MSSFSPPHHLENTLNKCVAAGGLRPSLFRATVAPDEDIPERREDKMKKRKRQQAGSS
jgi:hypothetical protein